MQNMQKRTPIKRTMQVSGGSPAYPLRAPKGTVC